MEEKLEKIFKDLYFVHLNKEIAKIIKKPLKDLVKTIKDV